jgi:hypothetical protein
MSTDNNDTTGLAGDEGANQQLSRIRAEIARLLSDPRTSAEHRLELLNDPLFAAILGEKS